MIFVVSNGNCFTLKIVMPFVKRNNNAILRFTKIFSFTFDRHCNFTPLYSVIESYTQAYDKKYIMFLRPNLAVIALITGGKQWLGGLSRCNVISGVCIILTFICYAFFAWLTLFIFVRSRIRNNALLLLIELVLILGII